jgi:hypothetical protein
VKIVLIGGPEDGREFEQEITYPYIWYVPIYEPITYFKEEDPEIVSPTFKKGEYKAAIYLGYPSMDDEGRMQLFWKGIV